MPRMLTCQGPFAGSDTARVFDVDEAPVSPFMLAVYELLSPGRVKAVTITHIDGDYVYRMPEPAPETTVQIG